MIEPIIRIADIAWIRLRSPDLDTQEQFLTDFGLTRTERTNNRLYMRAADPARHVHITEKGEPAVVSIAFRARSEDDLARLAREASGASGVEHLDEPGGGKRVRLTEHNGMGIEVVYGVEPSEPLPIERHVLNPGYDKQARAGEFLRVGSRPSQVKRIGHAVISTPDVEQSVQWAHRHLGILRSDDVHLDDDPNELFASFNRVDGGDDFVDHHVMMFGRHPTSGLNHVSFEVQDFDDLAAGHDFLKARHPDRHLWGIGRHTLGSQIFDYWQDPYGRLHEHWTDSDVLNNASGYRRHKRSAGMRSQWGTQSPQAFRDAASR
jgi:catechol 2,3-dioxygenase-like lactoylglutathione lyase family enzyme